MIKRRNICDVIDRILPLLPEGIRYFPTRDGLTALRQEYLYRAPEQQDPAWLRLCTQLTQDLPDHANVDCPEWAHQIGRIIRGEDDLTVFTIDEGARTSCLAHAEGQLNVIEEDAKRLKSVVEKLRPERKRMRTLEVKFYFDPAVLLKDLKTYLEEAKFKIRCGDWAFECLVYAMPCGGLLLSSTPVQFLTLQLPDQGQFTCELSPEPDFVYSLILTVNGDLYTEGPKPKERIQKNDR